MLLVTQRVSETGVKQINCDKVGLDISLLDALTYVIFSQMQIGRIN